MGLLTPRVGDNYMHIRKSSPDQVTAQVLVYDGMMQLIRRFPGNY
jgi:hypothetical protein